MADLACNYLMIGAYLGGSIFIGNMVSICIPNNRRVDPKYEWSNQNKDKFYDSLIISTTKGVISGVAWPYYIYRFVTNPSSIYNHYNLGYIYSPRGTPPNPLGGHPQTP
jgi:hypothetical protein